MKRKLMTRSVSVLTGLFGWLSCAICATNAVPFLLDRSAVVKAAAEVTLDAYPDAEEVVVASFTRIRYRADGTSEQWDDEYVKVLTEKGKRERRTISLHFTIPYEMVEVPFLEVIKPDGSAVVVDVKANSRVMVDSSQMAANIYNPNQKILKVSVPSLEVGDMCHMLSHQVVVKPRVPNTWSDYTLFEYTCPIKYLVYEIEGPKELPLRKIVLRDEIPGTVRFSKEEQENGCRYRWEVRDVPRMFEEPNMPPLYAVVQRLLVSTVADWREISRWYWNLCRPHLEAVTPAMKEKVAELVTGENTVTGRVGRIFQFVSQQIRYMGITTETEAPGYEPHDVRITFENRYGVCRDKAALLVAMLRLADIPAYPVLIHAGWRKDEEVPQPYFNHAIVAVDNRDGSYTLMDPTDENTRELLPAYLCDKSYLVAHPEGESLRRSPIEPAAKNMMRIRTIGKVDESGALEATSRFSFGGINDNAYRGYFSRVKPVERRRLFEGRLKDVVPGATVLEFDMRPADVQDVSQPLEVSIKFRAPDFPISSAGYAIIPPLWLGSAIGYANWLLGQTGLEKRKYPLYTEVACGVEEYMELELGEATGEVVLLPDRWHVATNKLTFVQTFELHTNVLQAAAAFVLTDVEFSPSEYLVLKQQLKDIEYARKMRPLFKSGRVGEPDVEVLLDETKIALEDGQNWSESRRVTMKILTYAGKKRFSELKLSFNPVWSRVKLDHATVTSPSGKVAEVAPEEMNIMDAPWVGSAPRYPAERTLVVSLPGVEVGSVVSYQVTRTFYDHPFFSTLKTFADFEPVCSNMLRVTVPHGVNLRVLDRSRGMVEARSWEETGRRIYEWRATRQSVIQKEDALPPLWSFCPSVFLSTGDWQAYLRQLKSVLEGAARDQSQTRARVRDVIAGKESARDRVVAIRDFVARNIRQAGPSFPELPLWTVSPADRTLHDGYGNMADRAVLLWAMLREAGFKPRFVLSSSFASRKIDLEEPLQTGVQRHLFDTPLVAVRVDGKTVILNDTDQYAALGTTRHDGKPAFELDGTSFRISAAAEMSDRIESHYEIRLENSGEARVTVTKRYFGTEFAAFHKRFAELPPEERRRHFLELIARLSQAAVAEGEYVTNYGGYPGVESFTVRIPRFAVRSGRYYYVTLPDTDDQIVRLRADERKGPLYVSSPLERETTFEVVLPLATRAIHMLPRTGEWRLPGSLGTVQHVVSTECEGDRPRKIKLRREVNTASAVIATEEYPTLLGMCRQMAHPETSTILLELAED